MEHVSEMTNNEEYLQEIVRAGERVNELGGRTELEEDTLSPPLGVLARAVFVLSGSDEDHEDEYYACVTLCLGLVHTLCDFFEDHHSKHADLYVTGG